MVATLAELVGGAVQGPFVVLSKVLSWNPRKDLGYGTSLQITVLNVHSVSFYAHFLKSNYYPEPLFNEHFIFI